VNKGKYNKAFSLIELSIVILVIGVLIAGVMEGRKMISKAKLSAARSLTKSSPVASIKDLQLWLEPTMEESFISTQANEGDNISQWNDINPQTNSKYFALKTATSAAQYSEISPIGSLPSIKFDGASTTNHYFRLSLTKPTIVDTGIKAYPGCQATYFLVIKRNSLTAGRAYIFSNTNGSTKGYGYYTHSDGKDYLSYPTINTYGYNATTQARIISHTFAGSTGYGDKAAKLVYVNGASPVITGDSICLETDVTRKFYIGASFGFSDTALDGYIS